MDLYRSHRTKEVRELCENNNIHLIYVPGGRTGELQPLDVGVFSIVAKKQQCTDNREAKLTFELKKPNNNSAAISFLAAFHQVTPANIRAAWKKVLN
jgi:hypothetical protein